MAKRSVDDIEEIEIYPWKVDGHNEICRIHRLSKGQRQGRRENCPWLGAGFRCLRNPMLLHSRDPLRTQGPFSGDFLGQVVLQTFLFYFCSVVLWRWREEY